MTVAETDAPGAPPASRAPRGWRRLIARVLPRHVYVPLRAELHLMKLRLRSRRVEARFRDARQLLVNVGAGSKGKPGWVNLDAWPGPAIDCVVDCRTSLPFPDGSVRAIFAEHFFEHLDQAEEVPRFLAECHRVLQPGGAIRLVVPDAEAYVRAYTESGWARMAELRSLGADGTDPYLGGRYDTKMQLLNAVFRQGHEHKYAYDYETLALLMSRHGFHEVTRQVCGRSIDPALAIDDPVRAPESLYVEAVKGEK